VLRPACEAVVRHGIQYVAGMEATAASK